MVSTFVSSEGGSGLEPLPSHIVDLQVGTLAVTLPDAWVSAGTGWSGVGIMCD